MLLVLAEVLPVLLKVIGIALIISFCIAFFAWLMANIIGSTYLSYVIPDFSFSSIVAPFSIFGVVGFMLAILISSISKHFFKSKIHPSVFYTLWGLWAVSIVGFCATGVRTAKEFKDNRTLVTTDSLQLNSDTLHLTSTYSGKLNSFRLKMDGLDVDVEEFKNLLVPEVEFTPTDSTSKSVSIQENRYAHGHSKANAKYNADQLPTYVKGASNNLEIPGAIPVSKAKKWRNQKLKYQLKIPIGTYVRMDNGMNQYVQYKKSKRDKTNRKENSLWLMTENGLQPVNKQSK